MGGGFGLEDRTAAAALVSIVSARQLELPEYLFCSSFHLPPPPLFESFVLICDLEKLLLIKIIHLVFNLRTSLFLTVSPTF